MEAYSRKIEVYKMMGIEEWALGMKYGVVNWVRNNTLRYHKHT